MSFFLTGTDTNVGKTYVAKLYIETLRVQGVDAVGYKPVCCGDREDARILAEASGGLSIEEVNPVYFSSPMSPYVAAMLENRPARPAEMLAGYHALSTRHEQVFVEGAGGWEVPLAPNYRLSDLAADLELPVIIVAANRLGVLNHLILTANAIRARGLICAGIILNQLEDEMDTIMITNKSVIEDLTGLPILDHIIYNQDFIQTDIFDKRHRV